MKGIIYYYSSTGNTALAVEYLKKQVSNIEIDLCNIAIDEILDANIYDIVGFASFAEYLGPPTLMNNFIENMNTQEGKPAFVLNTYGGFSGPTLTEFGRQVELKGFKLVSGFSLNMPMNYPPMRRRGKHSDNAPTPKDIAKYDGFIKQLELLISRIDSGETLKSINRGISLKKLVPRVPRTQAKKDYGKQTIDKDRCVNCGTCARVCGYKAIEMNPSPEIDHGKCNGCWACYNMCPKQAIYVKSYKGEHQYKGPSQELINKFI